MISKLSIFIQYIIPKHVLSRLTGYLAAIKWPWLKNLMIKAFINWYAIDMTTALQPDINAYSSLSDFFIRQLKPESRPVAQELNAIVSPTDSTISQFGPINHDQIIQAKGIDYSVEQLLGNQEYAQHFLNGQFITLYLSPKDYHRVHMPITGELIEMIHIPGSLFSVNKITAENISGLFTRNERIVNLFKTDIGLMAVVMVGALNVGSMHTTWAGKVAPTKEQLLKTQISDSGIALSRGDELGYFELGSTVIVLVEPNKVGFLPYLKTGDFVKYGQKIAEIS